MVPSIASAVFTSWELLEFSVVNIPANPAALALAVKNKSLKLSAELMAAFDVRRVPVSDVRRILEVKRIAPDYDMAIREEMARSMGLMCVPD